MNGTSTQSQGVSLHFGAEYVQALTGPAWDVLQGRIEAAVSQVLHAFESDPLRAWVPLSAAEVAALEASCPAWCISHGSHDWDVEGAQDGDWLHQSGQWEAVTVCLVVDRAGRLSRVDVVGGRLSERFRVRELEDAPVLVSHVADEWCEAVELLEAIHEQTIPDGLEGLTAEQVVRVRSAAEQEAWRARADVLATREGVRS